MNHYLRRVAKIVGGILFLVLGGIGILLPALQGWLFLLIGLSLLSSESPMAKRWLARLRAWAANLRGALGGSRRRDT